MFAVQVNCKMDLLLCGYQAINARKHYDWFRSLDHLFTASCECFEVNYNKQYNYMVQNLCLFHSLNILKASVIYDLILYLISSVHN